MYDQKSETLRHSISVEIGEDARSYEDALVKGILNGDPDMRVSEEAALVGAVLESLTPSLRLLTTSIGRQIGRTIFKRVHAPGISQADEFVALSTFFKAVGYENATFTESGGSVLMHIYKSCDADIGGRIHHFEAGLISGFVGASLGIPANAVETECANNGAKCCSFDIGRKRPEGNVDANLDEYINHIGYGTLAESTILRRYQMLSLMPLLTVAYESHIKTILSYIGACTAIARFRREEMASAGSRLEEVARIATVLGFGTAKYNAKPRMITSRLGGAGARIDFANVAGGFIEGMASKASKSAWSQTCSSKGGIYIVSIKDSGTSRRKK